ncbi:DEAD/DEAH box helicase [Xylophilus rhododendri]|uniref:DEAD/DEAH box helicase n=1 Tax=Xylophilus rhododendri TaxID=2697032 RepID=A0A857JB63_9BURK|nr:DEAD/DEAH box helicase [Xylophilus rhododendri]QHJ00300.1 DEAD/DEAH box helicase [Xylophilus rhododendri]
MTDTLAVQDAFAPADSFSSVDNSIESSAIESSAPEAAVEAEAEVRATGAGFVKLGLAPQLVQAVADLGYNDPTAVQAKVVPLAMDTGSEGANRFVDLMVSSQTGSGKTAAFLLPVLHTLLMAQEKAEADERAEYERAVAEAAARGEEPPKRARRKDPTNPRNFKAPTPGALILCPTRELAQQVANDAIDLVRHCRGLRIANVVGGIPYQVQIARLQNANLVVATPGRLLDLQRSQQLKLDQVKFLVVDEADRMLDLGFSDDLAEVNQLTIERSQTMMFSATFAPRIQQLAQRVMREPQRITIDSPQEKHANIEQKLYWADNAMHKRKMLDHWLRDTTINQAIVFASTQVECDGLANDLQQEGFSAVALHGALSQGLRNRRLMALRQGQVQILVATDVAARGIDVPTITHVFNFGLPMKAEDYTHRIGRTGRAGRDGIAVTFAEHRDRRKIFDIEGYSRQTFKADVIVGLEPQARFTPERPPRDNRGGPRGGPRSGGGGFGSSYARKPAFGDQGGRGGNEGFGGGRGGEGFGARAPQRPRPEGGGFGGGRSEGGFGRQEGFGGGAPRHEGFGGRGSEGRTARPAGGPGGRPAPAGRPYQPRGNR